MRPTPVARPLRLAMSEIASFTVDGSNLFREHRRRSPIAAELGLRRGER